LGVGHGYHWDGEKLQERWLVGKDTHALIWWYENGEIVTEPVKKGSAHWLDGPYGKGRIDLIDNVGSIYFEFGSGNFSWQPQMKERIIKTVQSKFPQITFYVYDRGGPVSASDYLMKLEMENRL